MYKTLFILFIGSIALFYSAWEMEFSFLSLAWFLYCLAWIPLIVLFISAYKYDNKNKTPQDLPEAKELVKLKIPVEK